MNRTSLSEAPVPRWALWAPTLALVGGCKTPPVPDPTYAAALPTLEDVNDAFVEQARGHGDRVRALYKSTDAIRGAAEPLVTLVAYSDFQCPFCGRFAGTIDELVRAYPDDLRVVFHQFPMAMHPDALRAARAAVAAGAQGRFWALHDHMFAHRDQLSRTHLIEAARGPLKLDTARFEAALDSEETARRVELEQTLGRRLGVRGTPSFFVNGRRFSGAMDAAGLVEIIEQERAFAQGLIEAGVPRRELYAHVMRAARVPGADPR